MEERKVKGEGWGDAAVPSVGGCAFGYAGTILHGLLLYCIVSSYICV